MTDLDEVTKLARENLANLPKGKRTNPQQPVERVGKFIRTKDPVHGDGPWRDLSLPLEALREKQRQQTRPDTEAGAAARRRKKLGIASTPVDNTAGALVPNDVAPTTVHL